MSTRVRSAPAARPAVASIPSVAYLKAANRFLGLSVAAAEKEEDEDKEETRAEEEPEAAEEEPKEDEKKGKKAKKGGKNCPAADEEDGDEPEAAAEEEDEDEDDDKEDEKKKAAAKATASERTRWASVLSSAEAKGRVPLACSLLADTDMNADTIRSALLASPVEGKQGLAARMAAVQRPDIGSGPTAAPQPGDRVAAMKALYNRAVGR